MNYNRKLAQQSTVKENITIPIKRKRNDKQLELTKDDLTGSNVVVANDEPEVMEALNSDRRCFVEGPWFPSSVWSVYTSAATYAGYALPAQDLGQGTQRLLPHSRSVRSLKSPCH